MLSLIHRVKNKNLFKIEREHCSSRYFSHFDSIIEFTMVIRCREYPYLYAILIINLPQLYHQYKS